MKTQNPRQIISLILYGLLIVCGLIFTGSFTNAGDEPETKINEKNTTDKGESPLLLVVVGGLIGIAGSIGSVTILFKLQSRQESKVFKRLKLEELIALAYQCDDWLDQLVLSYLVQGDISVIIEKFPVNRMKMIQALYFPTLKREIQTLEDAVKEFRKMAILERPNLIATNKYSNDFQKHYVPKQKAVLQAINGLMGKASTKQE